eukprot:765819-Hanusia_phi.AAC.2
MTLDGSSQRRVLWTASRLPDKQWNPGGNTGLQPCCLELLLILASRQDALDGTMLGRDLI